MTIWVVGHGDDLYVRAFHGCSCTWFRSVQDRHAGHVRAGGVDKDVQFVEEAGEAPAARAATLKLVPRPPSA